MSVFGELSRYIDAVVTAIDADGDDRSAALRATLVKSVPGGNDDLIACAERILGALEASRLAGETDASADTGFGPEVVESADTLAELCRIVLGR